MFGSIMKNDLIQSVATFLLSSLLLAFSLPVNAYKYQTPVSITDAVDKFLEDETQSQHYSITALDKRLRLRKCTGNLEVSFPQYARDIGRTSVEVSCNGAKSWNILVTVYIKKYLNIIIAKHSLPAGTLVTKKDISLKKEDVSRVRGDYFTNITQLNNMVLRRSVKRGKILSSSLLKPKQLVNRGDEILILAQTSNLTIKVKGKALMNGILGQRIRVKNLNSKRVFQATVISNGLVKVNM
jgi:flagella basal body P-ring formation protein FlgA